jgi:AAA+ ATPase superfamily predicted ATPase
MLTGFSNEEKIILYSITGGIPEYLSRIDASVSVKENVRELFFNPSGRMFEEPSNLLKQELKMPQTYNAIITAIAGGASRLNQIASKVGIETSQCSKMLVSLTELGLVKKEYPIIEQVSKRTIYILDDQMFIFWYRFVQPDISRITAGLGEVVCDEVFDGPINGHVGYTFEGCAIQYMWKSLKEKKLPVSFNKIGRWWGNNPKEKREEEIDFIAYSKDAGIFGECKWRSQPLSEDVLDGLVGKAELFPSLRTKYYFLFSRSGFTAGLQMRAERERNIILILAKDMFDSVE